LDQPTFPTRARQCPTSAANLIDGPTTRQHLSLKNLNY
jgi:hypothetical protein